VGSDPAPRSLAALTTLRVGGPAGEVVEPATEAELVAAVRAADADGREPLLLGGGSNVLVSDGGVPLVVLVRTRGVDLRGDADTVEVTAAAGEPWDDLVGRLVAEGLAGVEALAGIPGLVGATPIQNVGAYGQEVADVVAAVRVWDRRAGEVRVLTPAECGFGYRDSLLKRQPGRRVVLGVTLRLRRGPQSAPVRYAELASRLGVAVGDRAPVPDVREAVLALRRGKGMVLDPDDHDTWSAGSFFTNPLLPADAAAALPDGAPRFPQADGRVKTSAAYLIEAAGFARGWSVRPGAPAALSSKHVLAVTNRGGADAADLLELAAAVRAGVAARFGVLLEPEPVLVGCAL
jgi:UDP-N-acetylmuramate dehydrogenase